MIDVQPAPIQPPFSPLPAGCPAARLPSARKAGGRLTILGQHPACPDPEPRLALRQADALLLLRDRGRPRNDHGAARRHADAGRDLADLIGMLGGACLVQALGFLSDRTTRGPAGAPVRPLFRFAGGLREECDQGEQRMSCAPLYFQRIMIGCFV